METKLKLGILKMESNEEFMKKVEEATREPTLPEKTKDALNVKEVGA